DWFIDQDLLPGGGDEMEGGRGIDGKALLSVVALGDNGVEGLLILNVFDAMLLRDAAHLCQVYQIFAHPVFLLSIGFGNGLKPFLGRKSGDDSHGVNRGDVDWKIPIDIPNLSCIYIFCFQLRKKFVVETGTMGAV